MNIQVDQSRLTSIIKLDNCSHSSIDDGMCVMEAVAYVAGEPWSDAGDDARAAAGDAARAVLNPTVEKLRASTLVLIDRMIDVNEK